MKIDRIELVLCRLPYVHFFETSFAREKDRLFILVKVYAEGLCGYGECVASKEPLYSYETTQTSWMMLKDFLIPLLMKKSLGEPQEFYRETRIFKGHPMAKASLELALWDLLAKKEGVPLGKLYGGEHEEIPVGVSIGIQDSPSLLIERINGFLEEGYQRIKLKIKPGWDEGICRAVREKLPHIRLQVDANGAYRLEDRRRLLELDGFGLEMIEQPFPPYDLWDHAHLQKEMQTSLCLDESITSAETARKAMEMGSCRVINIKAGRVGGIVESLKIHDICQAHSVPVWCGGMLESGIGRAHNIHLASLPNFKFPHDLSASRRYYAEDLIEPPIDITPQGTIEVPHLSGIGVQPQEKRIKKASLKKEVLK